MNNGSLIKTIMNPHKSLESLDAAITEMENTIDELRKANDKLREEHYKDDTIAALRKELDWYYHHSFVISEDEAKEAEEWVNNHGCSGYKETKYIFTPTCVGTVGEVTCENCGKTFEFRSL